MIKKITFVYLSGVSYKRKSLIYVKLYIISFVTNKARYKATKVACGWAGAIFEVTRLFG